MRRPIAFAAAVLGLWGCPENTTGPEKVTPRIEEAPPTAKPAPKPPAEEMAISSSVPESLAEFKRGRELVENSRITEGLVHLQKAVELDKDFALGLAYLGFFTPTEEGNSMLERAVAISNDLPKPERLFIEHLLTWRQGDLATVRAQRKRLLTLIPNDWRVHYELGMAAHDEHNHDAAVEELGKAVELNPDAAPAYSLLGYSLMEQKKFDEAILALEQYAKRHPDVPTALDTLGEAQMRAGKVADAEATFSRAAKMGSGFWQAWIGVAQSHFFRSDFARGREALAMAGKLAERPEDKLVSSEYVVWSHLAEGDAAKALEAVTALEAQAKANRVADQWVQAPLLRAAIYLGSDKSAKVFDQVSVALDRARQARQAGDSLGRTYRLAFQWKVLAESRLGKLKPAEKSRDFLAKTAEMTQAREAFSTKSFATGLVSLVKKEMDAAVQQFSECIEDDWICQVELARTLKAKADDPRAKKVTEAIVSANRREPLYVYARSLAQAIEAGGGAPGAGEPGAGTGR